jgi:hypothetical protein
VSFASKEGSDVSEQGRLGLFECCGAFECDYQQPRLLHLVHVPYYLSLGLCPLSQPLALCISKFVARVYELRLLTIYNLDSRQ